MAKKVEKLIIQRTSMDPRNPKQGCLGGAENTFQLGANSKMRIAKTDAPEQWTAARLKESAQMKETKAAVPQCPDP